MNSRPRSLLAALLFAITGSLAAQAQTTATPVITLPTGSYVMPQSTTITDGTSGATIKWCYTGTGTCTPATTYSGPIYINPATTETICANATAPGDATSPTTCAYYTNESRTATPVITLPSNTYQMPQNTTITDGTSGATIKWCYVNSGPCVPGTTYTGSIYINPASHESICANATASGLATSQTTCNTYISNFGNLTFNYSAGQVTMSTTATGATIFYTLDGSTATEGSKEYTGPVTVAPGAIVHAIAVQTTSGTNTGVIVQNDQATSSNWKTVLASTQSQSVPYASNYNSPRIQYCATQGCNDGVTGIPTRINFLTAQPIPSLYGDATTTTLNFATKGLTGTYGSGTQVLWPYDAGGGCDTCTSMIEDFYIWPQYNLSATPPVDPTKVQNWEVDVNNWNRTSANGYLGAALQCSIIDGGWDFNGQSQPGWANFYLDPNDSKPTQKLNHDCQLPFGTLTNPLSNTATSFTVTPNVTGSVTAATVEPGMIVQIDSEEILCTAASGNTCTAATRGWAGTTATSHASTAPYIGSVHVQYHVSFKPGDTSVCTMSTSGGNVPVECVFIDSLYLNNVQYNFHTIYGEITVGGVAGYSALHVPAVNLPTGYPDRIYDQKQIDVDKTVGTSGEVAVGEFIDQDDVTASFGVVARQSYTVP